MFTSSSWCTLLLALSALPLHSLVSAKAQKFQDKLDRLVPYLGCILLSQPIDLRKDARAK